MLYKMYIDPYDFHEVIFAYMYLEEIRPKRCDIANSYNTVIMAM